MNYLLNILLLSIGFYYLFLHPLALYHVMTNKEKIFVFTLWLLCCSLIYYNINYKNPIGIVLILMVIFNSYILRRIFHPIRLNPDILKKELH